MNTVLLHAERHHRAHGKECNLLAERFNAFQSLQTVLVTAASRLLQVCADSLGVEPATADFDAEFRRVCRAIAA